MNTFQWNSIQNTTQKTTVRMSSAKFRPFCLCLIVLNNDKHSHGSDWMETQRLLKAHIQIWHLLYVVYTNSCFLYHVVERKKWQSVQCTCTFHCAVFRELCYESNYSYGLLSNLMRGSLHGLNDNGITYQLHWQLRHMRPNTARVLHIHLFIFTYTTYR